MNTNEEQEHTSVSQRDTFATLVGNIAIALGMLPLLLLLLEALLATP
jgi:hypothetical protein